MGEGNTNINKGNGTQYNINGDFVQGNGGIFKIKDSPLTIISGLVLISSLFYVAYKYPEEIKSFIGIKAK
ncbi:hypothetical protein CYY_005387 [Polysphondylium violaceum]|uniref:Uncharacterized protein n=1 Tax=Polysphondylium violaceum TaxID=133409 RepID=A0A8J4UZM2_9MYCE|nr:hypothetical protein CYY_005387 [Polysphondylium violaceum]